MVSDNLPPHRPEVVVRIIFHIDVVGIASRPQRGLCRRSCAHPLLRRDGKCAETRQRGHEIVSGDVRLLGIGFIR